MSKILRMLKITPGTNYFRGNKSYKQDEDDVYSPDVISEDSLLVPH